MQLLSIRNLSRVAGDFASSTWSGATLRARRVRAILSSARASRSFAAGLLALVSVIVPAARAASQVGSSAFTTIDVSGAGTGQFQGTGILGINSAEDVTGTYLDANGVIHGFVLPAGGTMTTFDATGAGTAAGEGTVPRSINSSGTITGVYFDSNKVCHGFVRAANGAISTFDAPGAGIAPNRGTSAMSINDSGVIVGFFSTGSGLTNTTYHGFLRAANGTIINIDAPEAAKMHRLGPTAMEISGFLGAWAVMPRAL